MNHIRVRPASRAALVTPRRLAMLATTAVKTSGGTASLSSWTNSSPTVVEGGGQPGDVAAAGDEAEADAEHEAGEDLDPERDPLEGGQDSRHAQGSGRVRRDGQVETGRRPLDAAGLPSEVDVQALGEVPDVGHATGCQPVARRRHSRRRV